MSKIRIEDFLPKQVEIETKEGIITFQEPTIKNLLEIQKKTLEIEKGEIEELTGSIEILTLLADKKEEARKLLYSLPYTKLLSLQKQIFKELGLEQKGSDEIEQK